MTTRLEIIQQCQARIGDEPILSEADAGAQTHLAIFDAVRDDLLSRYPWTFATVIGRRLVRLTVTPEAHWQYYYQLPSDMLGAPRALYQDAINRRPFTNFDITENRVATDAESLWISYTRRADPVIWPGYFRELVNRVIMAEMALSIREDSVMFERFHQVSFGSPGQMGEGGLMAQAKNMDSQSHGSVILTEGSNPLIDVRFG